MNQRDFLSFSELDNAASEVFLEDVADETALADLQPSNREETDSSATRTIRPQSPMARA